MIPNLNDEKVKAAERHAGLRGFHVTQGVLLALLALVAFTGSDVIGDPLLLLVIPIVAGSWTFMILLQNAGVYGRYKEAYRNDPAMRRKGLFSLLAYSLFTAAFWLVIRRIDLLDARDASWRADIIWSLVMGTISGAIYYYSMFRRRDRKQGSPSL
ncbi:hypothetical protein KQI65_03840 [bacterium]|nr:hypothetical protein [bacterium]